MQIAIDIPEEIKKKRDAGKVLNSEEIATVCIAIKNGSPLPKDHDQMAEELKRHREAWSKLKNDVVVYHNNYDYDTAMHFLSIIDKRISECRGDLE